jgi:hypothetical protein
MARPRVTIDDLNFAAEWVESYDPAPGETANAASAKRVTAWIKAEIAERRIRAKEDAMVRALCKQTGHSEKVVRASKTFADYRVEVREQVEAMKDD